MQDQGKRLLIAVALAIGVILVWNQFQHKEEPGKPGAAGSSAGSSVVIDNGKPRVGLAGPVASPDAARSPEQILKLTYPNVIAEFSSYCGGLKTWQLTDQRYEHDPLKGAILPDKDQLKYVDESGKRVDIPADKLKNLPACGAFEVNFASSTYVVPPGAVWKTEQKATEPGQPAPTEITYTYASDQLEVVKTFKIVPERYIVHMMVKVAVRVPEGTEAREQLAVSTYAYQDPAGLKDGSSRIAARVWSSSTYREGEIVQSDVNGVLDWPRFEPSIVWTGFEHPFLLSGYAPFLREGEHVEKHTSASDGTNGLPRGFMRTDLVYPVKTFKHGDADLTKEIVGYLGPKNYDDLSNADSVAHFETGFSKTLDLGWFAFIGKPLLWLLKVLHGVVGNWGVAIILLTILVKIATLYWTTKSMRSMKAMAALAPQMKALQAKYGDDKQRQQAETMALYKQHGVNPVAGCLPMLLQMPIWLALYRMLSNAGELYQQPFIPGWITDLTGTDPFYILPVALVVLMFVQARLQPAQADSAQQKMMQYGMPIMFGAVSFVCPAGLSVYMLVNTTLSALHSIYMNKLDKPSLEIAARMEKNKAAAAAEAATGKGSAAKAVAKPVIDAKATEVGDDATDDADGDDKPTGTGAPRNRAPRKKRRK
ncbi:MAG TPA: membrane protein insertase YidC [Kofleriaceae bacterium]|nr:membrane protein insertase YidC [Kofleriaceae bacterium]